MGDFSLLSGVLSVGKMLMIHAIAAECVQLLPNCRGCFIILSSKFLLPYMEIPEFILNELYECHVQRRCRHSRSRFRPSPTFCFP